MDFKVDYNALGELGEEVVKQNDNLESLFKDLIDLINDLDTGWVGPDCENFKSIATKYIKDLNRITSEIGYIGNYMENTSKVYSNNDNNWQLNMKKIGDDRYVYR